MKRTPVVSPHIHLPIWSMAMEAELLECVLCLSFCCLCALSIFPLNMVTIKRPVSRIGPGSRSCLCICEVYLSTMKAFCKLVQFGEPFGYKGEEQGRTARQCVRSSFLCLAFVCVCVCVCVGGRPSQDSRYVPFLIM